MITSNIPGQTDMFADVSTKDLAKYLRAQAPALDAESRELRGFNPCSGIWSVTIELTTGVVHGWEEGRTEFVFIKVDDAGKYQLLNEDHKAIRQYIGCYAPAVLDTEEKDLSESDYISFKVLPTGQIEGWNPALVELKAWPFAKT